MKKIFYVINIILILSTTILGCKKKDTVTNPNSTDSQIIPPSGYKLVWHDEFDKPTLDATKWNYEVNGNGM